ncbi:MAG: hypothetical protein Q4D04_09755, partial [Clostridia bacterium]|nr:hypothetical protein [Clostridia bacterium]
ILMLGSNDLRKSYAATPAQIGQDVQLVVQRGLRAHPAPPPGVLLLSPPPLLPAAVDGEFYDSTAPARCAELPAVYARIAATCGWAFEDAARYALPSELDGTHLDERGHSALANALLPVVRALCNVRP